MPRRIHSITRVVLLLLSVATSVSFLVIIVKNITDDRVIVWVVWLFTSLTSLTAWFFFWSKQPENSLSNNIQEWQNQKETVI